MLNGQTPENPDRSADEAAIRAVESRYDEAWGHASMSGLLAAMTDDVVIISPLGETLVGTAAFEQALLRLHHGETLGSTHASQIEAVHFVTDDVAIVDAVATIDGLRGPDGSMAPPIVHRFTDILVRRAGIWRIVHIRAQPPIDRDVRG